MADEAENVDVGSTPDEGSEVEAEAPETETPETADDSEAEGEEAEEEKSDEDDASEAAVRAFVEKKYGGDYKKFMDGLWNAQNSSAELHRTNQELREELAAIREMLSRPKEDPEEARRLIAQDPGVQAKTERYQDIEEQIKDTQQRRQEIINEAGELARKIARKEGALERADEFDKAEIQRDLQLLQREEHSIKREFEKSERDLKKLSRDQAEARREFEQAVKAAQTNRAQQSQAENAKQLEATLVYNDFTVTMIDGLKELGIAPDSEIGEYAIETVRTQLRDNLQRLGEAPGVDIAEATKALFAKFSKIHGLTRTSKFSDKSKAKIQGLTARPAPLQAKAKTTSSPAQRGVWTADDARSRAAEVARKLVGR